MKWMLIAVAFIWVAPMAISGPSDEARAGFRAQMDAWNRGDLDGALRIYLNDPQMIFVSKSGIERGLTGFAQAMSADFGGHPERMGVFSGEFLETRDLGPDHALLVVRWSIVREQKRLFGGVSTQIWRRVGADWRITVEHAS